MRPDLTIRSLQAADRAGWTELWRAYLAFYGTERPEAVYDLTFARNMNPDHEAQHCLVAAHQGRLVGLAHIIYHPHNWQAEDICYLQDLYADPSVRGQGVGRALIEAVYAAADKAGCPNVYWTTQEFNYQGRMLYDRVGTKTPFIKYQR
ncbi:MAG: GNAT family N-acetyltransferase [Pseudomonadota bacterium]